jgi:hypothetical protein
MLPQTTYSYTLLTVLANQNTSNVIIMYIDWVESDIYTVIMYTLQLSVSLQSHR